MQPSVPGKKDQIVGNIHNITPVKKSKNQYEYFNFNIQTEDKLLQELCSESYLKNIENR